MSLCYVLPGLLSSQLRIGGPAGRNVWADNVEICLGTFGTLRLADDGISPGAPDGLAVTVGDPLPDYWQQPIAQLTTQLAAYDTHVVPYPYDWRQQLRRLGPALAARIRAEVSAADPCSIVAHSYGGLVARWAWYELTLSGDTDLVRRIVTLGTPHQGSYTSTLALGVSDHGTEQLLTANQTAYYAVFAPPEVNPVRYWNVDSLTRLVATWPCFYDTLPLLGSPDSASDPNRSAVYDASQWAAGGHPSQAWLDQARTITHPTLLSPDSMPPSWVLTTVGGGGSSTPARLTYPDRLGQVAALEYTPDGDETVAYESSVATVSAQYRVLVRHSDMPAQLAANGIIASLVIEQRGPPTPIPPLVSSSRPLVPELSGPPLAGRLYVAGGGAGCVGGRCTC